MDTMQQHTGEPWRACKALNSRLYIWSGDTPVIQMNGANKETNARRIVACVNACAGIPTDLLEALPDFEKAGLQTINQVIAQRDKLLAALKQAKALAPLGSVIREDSEALIAEIEAAK
jgi:hypothetical protein